jgi:NADH-quinone oxidoreductase subunit L
VSGALLALLVVLPAAAGAALALGGRRTATAAMPVAVATSAVALGVAVVAAVRRPSVTVPFLPGAPAGLAVDALAATVLPAVTAVALLVLVFSTADVRESRSRFAGLMLLFEAAVALTVVATTLPALLVAWEVMGATSYAMIGFSWRQPGKVGAGAAAFLTTRTADLGLYLAAGAALAGGSGLALADLPAAAPGWRDVVAAGVLVAALGKAAQLPFSFWLSRAMEGPSPVSALLHSAAMVAMGGYLLLRAEPLLAATGWAPTTTAWLGAATAVLLGAVAVAQRDLKQLLAASTSAQLGFVVLAAGVGSVAGGAAQLVAHAATKALLFLAAGAWLSALGTKQLGALRGAARCWPLLGGCATVGLLALAGMAPLSLWATKDDVLAAARENSPALYVAGLAAVALSAAYAAKPLWLLWRPLPGDAEAGYDTEEAGTRTVRTAQRAPLVVLAAGAAVLGLLVWPPVGEVLRRSLGEPGAPRPTAAELAGSAVLAAAVILGVRRWAVPEPGWAAGWLRLGDLAHAAVVRPVLRLAGVLARFDDRVLDRGVDALAGGVLRTARVAAVADTGVLDRAVTGVAAGARGLGRLARRSQTGLVHQYYVQAAAVLAAALLLLLIGT